MSSTAFLGLRACAPLSHISDVRMDPPTPVANVAATASMPTSSSPVARADNSKRSSRPRIGPLPPYVLDALELHNVFSELTDGHFRQFGFMDRSTCDGFVQRVVHPNVAWVDMASEKNVAA